jgi:hypothetical protein
MLSFAHDILGPLVGPESEVDGLAQHLPDHSANLTSATSEGLTQVVAASSFTLAGKGDLGAVSFTGLT